MEYQVMGKICSAEYKFPCREAKCVVSVNNIDIVSKDGKYGIAVLRDLNYSNLIFH